MFTCVDIVRKSRNPEWQQRGKFFPDMTRVKTISSEMKEKIKAHSKYGCNKGTLRQLRLLSDTSPGGHAYDESTPSQVIRKGLIAKEMGVGIGPQSVMADMGAGSGATLWCQYILARDSVCVGVEEDQEQHCRLQQILNELKGNGWPGKASTRCIEALHAGPYHGVTHVDLYDGNPTTNNDRPDLDHIQLIGQILSTPSVNVLWTTKFAKKSMDLYASLNRDVAENLHKFKYIYLANSTMGNNNIRTKMYIKHPEYRLAGDAPSQCAGSSEVVPEGVIQQLIRSASEGPPPADEYGRFQRIDVELADHLQPAEYICSFQTTNDKVRRQGVVGASYALPLLGLKLKLQDKITLHGGETVRFLGVAPLSTPTSVDYILALWTTPSKEECWVLPVDHIREHHPREEHLDSVSNLSSSLAFVKKWTTHLLNPLFPTYFCSSLDGGSGGSSLCPHNASCSSQAPTTAAIALANRSSSRNLRYRAGTRQSPKTPTTSPTTSKSAELERSVASLAKRSSDLKRQAARITAKNALITSAVKQKQALLKEKEAVLGSLRKSAKNAQRNIVRETRKRGQSDTWASDQEEGSTSATSVRTQSAKKSKATKHTEGVQASGHEQVQALQKELADLKTAKQVLEVDNARQEEKLKMSETLRASDKDAVKNEALNGAYREQIERLTGELESTKQRKEEATTAEVTRVTDQLITAMADMQHHQVSIKELVSQNQYSELETKLCSNQSKLVDSQEKIWLSLKADLQRIGMRLNSSELDEERMGQWPEAPNSSDQRSARSRSRSKGRGRGSGSGRKRVYQESRSTSQGRMRKRVRQESRNKDYSRRGRDKSSRSRSKHRSRWDRSRSRSKEDRSNNRSRWNRSRSKGRYRRGRSKSKSKDSSRRDKSRSRSKDRSRRDRIRSKSKDRSRGDRSRSRSKDRTRRDRSRSKSKNRSRRDRSRSKDRSRRDRSRSRSKDRTRRDRSRSKSKDRSRRDRSRSRSRSKSKDRSRRNKSKDRSTKNSKDRLRNRSRSKGGSRRSRSKSRTRRSTSGEGGSKSRTEHQKSIAPPNKPMGNDRSMVAPVGEPSAVQHLSLPSVNPALQQNRRLYHAARSWLQAPQHYRNHHYENYYESPDYYYYDN
jgi:hypothetical protein